MVSSIGEETRSEAHRTTSHFIRGYEQRFNLRDLRLSHFRGNSPVLYLFEYAFESIDWDLSASDRFAIQRSTSERHSLFGNHQTCPSTDVPVISTGSIPFASLHYAEQCDAWGRSSSAGICSLRTTGIHLSGYMSNVWWPQSAEVDSTGSNTNSTVGTTSIAALLS